MKPKVRNIHSTTRERRGLEGKVMSENSRSSFYCEKNAVSVSANEKNAIFRRIFPAESKSQVPGPARTPDDRRRTADDRRQVSSPRARRQVEEINPYF